MHHFAYGYEIVFDVDVAKESNAILVNKTTTIPLEKYIFRVEFDTNQDRNIFVKAKHDFTKDDSLTDWIFVVEDVVTFLCNGNENKILYYCDEKYSDTLMNYWLIHIVLPIYFTLNTTYYFLHTGSVSIDNRATLFLGNSYAGKSTLTDYFLKKNHSLVSDDKLATFYDNEKFYCQPSHSFHRPYRETESLGIRTDNFSKETLAIGVIYWIIPVEADKDIKISELKALEKFKVLRYSTEMDLYVNQEKRFEYITKLANNIKVFSIDIPRDLNRLEEVYNKIINHNISI